MNKLKLALVAFVGLFFSACGENLDPVQASGLLDNQCITWKSLQSGFATKNNKVGTDADIGYKFEQPDVQNKLFKINAYFDQETKISDNMATYTVTMKKAIGECKNGVWTMIYNANNPRNPLRTNVIGENCENFLKNFCTQASSGKCGMEEIPIAVQKPETELAMEELKAAAKKWLNGGEIEKNGTFFSFKSEGSENDNTWKATSKKQIGDCPAKSVIEMSESYGDGSKSNKVPSKCKALAPKEVTSYK
jgi:hypothetical protein